MGHPLNDKFAPTPLHGAAYAVAIREVGGIGEIAACDSPGRYAQVREKLDALLVFARGQDSPSVLAAYEYGVAKVDADLLGRMEIIENSRKVNAALATLPQPEGI